MTRHAAQTIDDLERTDHPLRVRDVMRLTGWSYRVIMDELDEGRLKGFRRRDRPGYPWCFKPADVRAWWHGLSSR